MNETRQLAAIMFTDIVGYTALMGKDETAAYQLLKKNRKVQRPLIEKHKGIWLKEIGDGVLASFQTVSDAVHCAIEIQRESAEEPGLKLRIGIHLGEVIMENGDVFGDGVNIASRLESLATAGGIYVSESVYRNIKNRKGIITEYVREENLKNVDHPVRIYGIDVAKSEVLQPESTTEVVEPLEKSNRGSGVKYIFGGIVITLATIITFIILSKKDDREISERSAELTTKDNSIAVLPFTDLSENKDQEYICIGMMEAILSHLSKIEGLRLTSRTTMMTYKGTNKKVPEIASEVAVKYVLEGSVLKADNTIRITTQLIDGLNDEHIWSDYYDGNISDLLNIQSDIAQNISEMLEMNINQNTRYRIEQLPTENGEAYDLYLTAIHSEPIQNMEDPEKYVELLEEAISIDPEFGLPYTKLAGYWSWRAFMDRKLMYKAESLYNLALKIDPNQATAHRGLSGLSLWYKWDFLTAERESFYASQLEPSNVLDYGADLNCAMGRFKEGLESISNYVNTEPNNGRVQASKAMVLYFNKRPKEALETLELAKGKNFKGNKYNYYGDGGRAYLYMKEYQKAVDFLEEGIREGISGPRHLGTLAIAYYHLSNIEKSDELMARIPESDGISHSLYIAMNYAQRGDIDAAFQWLDSAYNNHEPDMFWIKVEPPLEPLHDDPRWHVLLEKIGFPN